MVVTAESDKRDLFGISLGFLMHGGGANVDRRWNRLLLKLVCVDGKQPRCPRIDELARLAADARSWS